MVMNDDDDDDDDNYPNVISSEMVSVTETLLHIATAAARATRDGERTEYEPTEPN